MEIYKELTSPASQQFEKLLNSQLSKNKIEEGKIIEGKVCLLYTSPSPRDDELSRMPSSA